MAKCEECEIHAPLNAKQDLEPVIVKFSGENKLTEGDIIPPDGGWRAWLVCLASFYTNGALFGVMNSAGVMYVKLKEQYAGDDEGSSRLSLVGSLAIGTTFLLSPIASILTDRLGIRKTAFIGSVLVLLGMILSSFVESLEMLYLTYGVLFGTGASLAYTPSLVILGHYFKRNLGIVNGFVTAGSSLFTIVIPLLMNISLKKFGLATTFQILTAMMSPLLGCALLFKPLTNVQQNNQQSVSRQKSANQCGACCSQIINTSIWKNKKYMVWALAFPVSLLGYFVPYMHLVKHVNDILPDHNGELLIICIGAASGVGRLIFGKIADVPNVSRILLQQLSFFSLGVLTMLLAAANAYWILIVICLGLGLFDGCFISLLGPIAFDIVGMKGASQAIGFLLGICSLPLTFGPPIAGWMYDHLGKNYKIAFIAAGAPPIIGSLLMFIIARVKQPIHNDECNNHDLPKLKPSVTEDTVLSQDNTEDYSVVWKRRIELQTKQENGLPISRSLDGYGIEDEKSTV